MARNLDLSGFPAISFLSRLVTGNIGKVEQTCPRSIVVRLEQTAMPGYILPFSFSQSTVSARVSLMSLVV